MKRISLILFFTILIFNSACQRKGEYYVKGVEQPVISQNGTWKVTLNPYEKILKTGSDSIHWYEIEVPGECMMQGIPIKHDQPFVYSHEINIPSDFEGKLIKIRFEGVYSYAKVWVNGNFIRDHSGGFTAWECDITSSVKPGEKANLIVEVTDRADEISYASGYAKHQIGGILRNVSLMALPENYPEFINVTTDLDDKYKDVTLKVTGVCTKLSENCKVALDLFDADEKKVKLNESHTVVTGNEFEISNLLVNPLKWDPEHPNLYTLRVTFIEKSSVTWQKNYLIGFREIEVAGNKFLVNGRQVKLRGACRHDIHPLLGRLSTPEYDRLDVLLAKEANINFIRTSHYPPDENFLSLCDKYGIFVEDETAVCFVGSHRTAEYYPGASESYSDFTDRYLSQLKEMVTNHRNHPSVIIWSIGNENTFGTNFKKSYDWVKATDPTRPVIFSYPGLVPDSIDSYDIISMHYPGTNGNMNQYGITTVSFGNEKKPVIFDEWAHVPCYNSETVSEDPNIRDFWGISLDTMWQKAFESDGGLGGSIWGMIDETFMLPSDLPGYNEWWGKLDKNVIPGKFTGHTIGYGEWGIFDTWRRKKPEFWNVKKAYSPVRVLQTENYEFIFGNPVEIPVLNRFDFTNLNEITLKLTLNGRSLSFGLPDIPPHSKGIIPADIPEWPSGMPIFLDFFDRKGVLIDSYTLTGRSDSAVSDSFHSAGAIEVAENNNEYTITCNNNIKFRLNKTTGLFTSFETSSGIKQVSGPFINLRIPGKEIIYSSNIITDLGKEWKMKSLSVEKKDKSVYVSVKGNYSGNLGAEFTVLIYPDATVSTGYIIKNIPEGYIREAGLKYVFDNVFDSLSWKRKPYWSRYPADHLSAHEGNVPLYTANNKTYRLLPDKKWQYDKKSFFYSGIENETDDELVNIARATKENIFEYNLNIKGGGSIVVTGKGDKACRIEKTANRISLTVSDLIDYPDISWGNYSRNISPGKNYSGKTEISFQ
jgi:beta-galactosidase